MRFSEGFTRFSHLVARGAGDATTFVAALALIVVWAVTGPLFHYSDTWQLVINTSTTIVTFLMVFLIQNTQNRDGAAIQAKLDELIRASGAENRFIGIENLTQEEVDDFRLWCEAKAQRADRDAKSHARRQPARRLRAHEAVEQADRKADKAADAAV
jgi:low affinity Fe/Cu permease